MDNPWNVSQSNLRSYKPRFLHRNHKEQATRSKNDPFVDCNLHSPEKYKCQKCYFQSDLKVLLTKHFHTVHKTKNTQHYPTPVLRYCQKCGFQAHSSLVLLNHNNACARNGNTSSGYIVVRSNDDLYGKLLEREEEIETNRNMPFQCEHCAYRSTWRKSLKVHLRTIHPSLDQNCWFRCDHCPYRTTHRGHMNRHLEQHFFKLATQQAETLDTKKQIDKCDQCGIAHNASHAKKIDKSHQPNQEKAIHFRFQCVHCSFVTVQHACLKIHLCRMHPALEQGYWLNCGYCSYQTKHKGRLNRHLSLHMKTSDLRKKLMYFQCEQCSYEHVNIRRVTLHMQQVHTPNVNSAGVKNKAKVSKRGIQKS